MDNSLLVGLSAQQVLRSRMDISANNVANMDTIGFKTEGLVFRELSDRDATSVERTGDVTFVDGWTLQRDFSNGPLERTDNPLDVAIEGDGFFVVEGPGGAPHYTRDGRFTINVDGQLATREGRLVLGEGDAPIRLNEAGGPITISDDGAVAQGNAPAGRLQLVAFETPGALEKVGDNLLKPTGQEPVAVETTRLAQGFVEGSNVNGILEMTRLIETSRAYESVSRMLNQSNQLRETAIQKLARVS